MIELYEDKSHKNIYLKTRAIVEATFFVSLRSLQRELNTKNNSLNRILSEPWLLSTKTLPLRLDITAMNQIQPKIFFGSIKTAVLTF